MPFGLSGSELQAFIFIREYLNELKSQGYSGKCFTYRGLRAWWSRNRKYEGSEWHTVERAIRRLAEKGVLRRVNTRGRERKRLVLFCVTPEFEAINMEYERYLSTSVRGGRRGVATKGAAGVPRA